MAQSLISSLTPFKGGNENFDFFIKQFIEIAKLEKWGEAKKILVLKLNLKDEALKFLVSNPKFEEIDNFDSLVKKLEEKFCKKPNFEEAQRQFNNLKQKVSQSISDLAEQVSSTTDKFSNPNNSEEENIINLTEKLKLSKFIEALRPDIRVEVKKLGPKNFKSAVAIAKNIDNALSDDGAEINVTDSGINQILSQQLSTNKQILELSEKVNAISSQNLCVNSLTEAPATNSNNVQSYQQSPCQICGKLNHKANNCFHFTRGNYYRGNVRANYNRTFRANNFHPYRSRANHRSNSGRGFRGIYKKKSYDFENKKVSHVTKKKQTNVKVLERHDGEKSKDKNVIKKQNSQTKKSKNKNSVKQPNQNKEKVLDNSENKVLMSCTNNSNNLPIVNIKICGIQLKCLIDSGANVSLIQPHIVDQIKTKTKVEYISRMVRIKTIDNTVVPYMSAINLKFKIEKKWFSNQFFVTLNSWNAHYHAILGYDFLQRNKVVIDTVNKQLLVGNQKFDFEENSPTNVCSETTDCDISESDKNKKESFEQVNNNFGKKVNVSEETFHALNVKIANNITVQPFSTEIINLKVPKNISKNKDLIFIPKKNKLGYLINESLNVPTNANLFHTIIENNTNKVIHVRKNTIMGKLSTFDVNDIMSPSESEIYQINNLNLNEIHKMRRDELLKSDFKLDHLNDKDKKDMQDLLLKNYKVFSKSYKTLGETSAVIPEFSLLHNFPLQTKPYSIPLMAKKYAQQEINNLLEAGIIEPSSSSYCFPVIFIKKKQNPNDSNSELKFRMVVDYRLLNSITETFKICLPKISEIIKSIAGRKIYCVLDLKSAFFQIKLRDEDKRKLAFCTEMGKNVQFFLDDIIIAADSLCELKVTLQAVFDRLIKFNLTLDPAKLQLCKPEITYLGFDLNANGFSPSEQNVNKVTNFPRPKNLKQVQMFLGMLNYFRGLIYDYAGIVEPLVKLTKKNTPFVWSVDCENAFNTVQEIILKKPTLKNFDPNLPISLITDASKIAICGILLQKKDNVYYPLEFFSRKLTPAECKYPSIRRELLAIYASVKHFHDQLLGENFELLTDAKPLTEYQSLDKKPEIVARWLLYLGTFSFTPTHIPGSLNPADFLSRVVEENSLNVNNITLFQPNDKLSMQNISIEQKQDAILSKIMNDLSVNKQCKQYFLDVNSGLLMIKNAHKNKKKIVNRIVIPKSLIKVCIETAHAPHFGVRKTFEFIRQKYQWKGMYLDTKNFCEHCEKCLVNKPKAKLTQTQMIPKRNLAPGQCIAIDVVGKLPRSTDNKNFILTIIDHYSRYLEAYPLQNITSRTIINCLNKYFANFGLPKFLITDNATNFISNEMVKFLDRLNIQHRKSSIYYPMANGLLERAHRTMKESLASMCESTFQWSEKLLFFKLYYNNSIHSVTKFAPAEIFFGRKQNLPLDSFFEPITVENESKYLKNIRNNMCSIRNEFAKNEEQYFKNNAPHIKGRKVPNFNLGDKVFVKNFSHPHVFQEKYKGPFEIIKILRNNNYVIKSLQDNKTMKLNVSKIFKQEQPRPNLRN
ncbi:Transposon Tf2-6 polyprotein [Araneus ventricosus]|uniref:RNA-directed DNA polymerase n=1 Tax=Araneus ventricosus TaxID=182803 RepID=A0A4Y2VE05_ARAVE|nr:Transposon Tf2-6 polyprotein [Araneus ventricosus]